MSVDRDKQLEATKRLDQAFGRLARKRKKLYAGALVLALWCVVNLLLLSLAVSVVVSR